MRVKQLIAGVRTNSGDIMSDHKAINEKFGLFYSKLYTSDCVIDLDLMENFFRNLDVPFLSQDISHNLEAPTTQEEFIAAISSMQSVKSPGLDGFPTDFFKKFCTELALFYV